MIMPFVHIQSNPLPSSDRPSRGNSQFNIIARLLHLSNTSCPLPSSCQPLLPRQRKRRIQQYQTTLALRFLENIIHDVRKVSIFSSVDTLSKYLVGVMLSKNEHSPDAALIAQVPAMTGRNSQSIPGAIISTARNAVVMDHGHGPTLVMPVQPPPGFSGFPVERRKTRSIAYDNVNWQTAQSYYSDAQNGA
ncbi:hypothetical protein K461DRAFT_37678 [Myriangium duriaei CBS 260.36]|uniref:Uncharacterized protein n=1 Tax=Myriangium duriaei CBS 260.36 TaxID=1168546 RepID=A0A9P4J041_9PEZI|nr:hypothetical protein K461DRAFT_37678 [Myriangium duriaei CBS 260.36]